MELEVSREGVLEQALMYYCFLKRFQYSEQRKALGRDVELEDQVREAYLGLEVLERVYRIQVTEEMYVPKVKEVRGKTRVYGEEVDPHTDWVTVVAHDPIGEGALAWDVERLTYFRTHADEATWIMRVEWEVEEAEVLLGPAGPGSNRQLVIPLRWDKVIKALPLDMRYWIIMASSDVARPRVYKLGGITVRLGKDGEDAGYKFL